MSSEPAATEAEVVIVGGGPSGAAAAHALAGLGHSVVLLTRTPDPDRARAESLPPSTRKLLGELRVLEVIDRAGFYRTTGNTVWWGAREGDVELFDSAGSGELGGYQVFRPDFDRLLLAAAREAGARIQADVEVRHVDLTDSDACIEYVPQPATRIPNPASRVPHPASRNPPPAARLPPPASLRCRFVLDCSGRAGVIARCGYRLDQPGFHAQAFVGVWQSGTGWPLSEPTHTIVETYDDGWGYSVPLSPTARHIGVVVDSGTTQLTRDRIVEARFRGELAKTRKLAMLTESATLVDAWACAASMYSAREYAGPAFLLVGDAGSFLEPLSSFGVKKALASGWLAAIAVHTALAHPARSSQALDFFSRRERQVYDSSLRRSCQYAREAYESHPHAFWQTRATVTPPPLLRDEIDEHLLLEGSDVKAAFERLKAGDGIRLSRSTSAPGPPAVFIRGQEIVIDEAVSWHAEPRGVRFLAGVDLVALRDLACDHTDVPAVISAYQRRFGETPLPNLLGALSVLVAKRVLIEGG
jgi:flavin-dependent dehydrogenase